MTEPLYTTQEAATRLGVRPNLIAYWKHTGRIEVAGATPRANGGTEPLYRLSELRPLADRYHQRAPQRRRDPRPRPDQ